MFRTTGTLEDPSDKYMDTITDLILDPAFDSAQASSLVERSRNQGIELRLVGTCPPYSRSRLSAIFEDCLGLISVAFTHTVPTP